MELHEMGVRVREVNLNGARGIRPTAPGLRQGEFESIRQIEPCPVLLLGDRIDDGLSAGFDDTWYDIARPACVDVYVELDLREHRIVDLFQHRKEDLKERRSRLGVLATHDAQDRIALCRRGSLVYDRNRLTVTFMNRAWPTKHPAEFQSIELGISVMALIDGDADDGLTVTVSRQRVELTGATVCAITMGEVFPSKHPLDLSHRNLLSWAINDHRSIDGPYQFAFSADLRVAVTRRKVAGALANDRLILIFPTFGGHLQKGILALNEVFHGTQRLQAVQPGIQIGSRALGFAGREAQGANRPGPGHPSEPVAQVAAG